MIELNRKGYINLRVIYFRQSIAALPEMYKI